MVVNCGWMYLKSNFPFFVANLVVVDGVHFFFYVTEFGIILR